MITVDSASSSQLLAYLPALYQQDPFLGRFLLAFEKLLFGRKDGIDLCFKDNQLVPRVENEEQVVCYQALEEVIAGLAKLFDPYQTPTEFIPWLASWTAFTLRADLNEVKQRRFIAEIVSLYRRRGTKENLQKLLELFTIGTARVIETEAASFQIGVHSKIGIDTAVGGGRPYFFKVVIFLPQTDNTEDTRHQLAIARALIELEKPAHTDYLLDPIFPSMQIGVHSTVGVDTLLGAILQPSPT